jgi:hypothetical protein
VRTPTGRLRPGFVRIAGVVSEEVYHEVVRFMLDRGYPTISKALGALLEECIPLRPSGVSNSSTSDTRGESASHSNGVANAPDSKPGGL